MRVRRLLWPSSLVAAAFSIAAGAEPARLLTHDGSSMALSRTADGIEIAYVEVPPALRELGVTSGTVLMRGKWSDTVLVGEAFAFQKGCAPVAYPVRGVVERSGALIIIGPMPTSCSGREYSWGDGAVMVFEPGSTMRRTERVAKPKPQPKPKPKAKPKPRAAPQPQPSPPQWRWF